MDEYTPDKNDKTEDIQMVNDFKDELERIKKKLASDFTKYSELDKKKNKKKILDKDNIIIQNEVPIEKKEDNIFNKKPTIEDLKLKYGLEPNKKKLSDIDSNISTTSNQNSSLNNNNPYNFMKKIDIKKINNNSNRNMRSNNININNLKYNNSSNIQNITTFGENDFRKKYVNIYNDIDTDDRNENNFTFKNIKKLPKLKTESNIDNNNNYNNNYLNREERIIESINGLNNNNSLLLNSKLDEQIKIINEKSENNRLEEEKTQMKIRQIENKLQLDERLIHNNREIRKNALRELTDMCQRDFNINEDKQKVFDYFSPWVKKCLEETNSYVIPECLNFFIIFNSLFPNFLIISNKDFFDNIERFISFGMFSINENCAKIFMMLFKDRKLYNQAFNEILKLLDKSISLSTKINKFIQEIIIILFEKKILQENYVKILFEKIIHIYSNINIKNNDKKKIFEKLIKNIYIYIADDYEIIKNNIKLTSYKELDNLFNTINTTNFKKNSITYILYPRPIHTDVQTNNNTNDYFDSNNNNNDRLLTDRKNTNYKSIYEKNNINKTPEKKNNNNQIGVNGEINDIISILPNDFFEYHFEVRFQAKMQILENVNEILNNIKIVKDKDKNLIDVYKIINYSIEDSNILIHLEGIKLLENICRLINKYINIQKLKLILEKCFDKLKDKKSIIKNELFNLFNIIIEYQCLELNKFMSFILNFCCNEKNDNSIIKLGLLEYIKSLFLQQNKTIQKQINNISEKEYIYFTKKVINIIEKESLSLIKDLCSDLLIIFKRKINSQRTFYELIDKLPNYRKKIIHTEEKNELNESDYKKNLKHIKSSYSFSNIKKRNKNGNSYSNLNTLGNDSSRSNDNNYYKIKIRGSNNSIIKNKRYSSKKNINKINKLNISLNKSNSQRKNRLNINKVENGNNIINKTEITEANEKKNDIKDKENKKINKPNNKNNIDDFNKRKNELLKSIENINEDTIEKYSKLIIKDFLVFVKKIFKQKNEDLSTHFELIFMIYEKIFFRIVYIMKENKNIKKNISKYKNLIDELMNYLTKILILTPGIQQIKGSSKFNVILFEKYLSVFKNFCFNKEKYYLHILLNLYKLCEGKDEDYPKNFDPKSSVIFFLKYDKIGNKELNSKRILIILKEFIAETNILSLSEKTDLLEGIELNSDEGIDEIKNENYEEKSNIIIDKEQDINKENINCLPINDEEYSSKLNKNDLDKIEESIQIMSNILNSTNLNSKINNNNKEKNKQNENDQKINDENKIEKKRIIDNNEIKKNMNALNIPLSLLKNKISLNNNKKLLLKKISPDKLTININNDIKEKQNIKDSQNKIKNINSSKISPKNSKPYIQTLNQIIKTLNNESTEEGIFNIAILQFLKLSSIEQKLDYFFYLQKSLDPIILKSISINILIKFYDYILSILSLEILKFSNEEQIIIKFQTLAQNLLKICKTNDMFKVLLLLLKKYFPKDLNNKIEDISLVMIKIIAFLLKELLKNIKKEKIISIDIISQINDLLANTPPSNLTTLTPNCSLYQNIFSLLKSITDEIISQNKEELNGIIQHLQNKQIICNDYIQYLIKLNNTK